MRETDGMVADGLAVDERMYCRLRRMNAKVQGKLIHYLLYLNTLYDERNGQQISLLCCVSSYEPNDELT